MNIVNTNDRHKVLGLLLICLFSIVVVFINRKIDVPAEETFMALWDEYKNSDQFTDVKRQLIKELNFQCPGCPPVNCPVCYKCIQCDTCATQATVTCPECETCSQLESAEKTVAELAAKYLVIDFEPFENNAQLEKFDFVPQQTLQYKCESNPELDKYVRKPQFSRDHLDYDVQRSGYVPRRLVCDELATHEAHVQSKHWLDQCDNVEPLNSVITVIGSNLTQVAIDRINELELRIVPTIEEVKSPYSLVLTQHFDFEALDANLWRMVREAENQNADLVFGSWRNEQGQWSSSCLHYNVQNYTLHVWDGYYKSISSMKYCDMAIGPVLVRSEHFDTKLISLAVADRIDYHLRRPDLRVITCLDCMFYQGGVGDISKETMQPLAFIYTLNQIDYLGAKFEYTCPEAGIECNVKYYDQAGLAQPPCCLRILTGMTMAMTAEYKQHNESLCVYCGQVLAALKMPGGQLPWDTDVDMPMMAANFEFNVDNIVTSSVSDGAYFQINVDNLVACQIWSEYKHKPRSSSTEWAGRSRRWHGSCQTRCIALHTWPLCKGA